MAFLPLLHGVPLSPPLVALLSLPFQLPDAVPFRDSARPTLPAGLRLLHNRRPGRRRPDLPVVAGRLSPKESVFAASGS